MDLPQGTNMVSPNSGVATEVRSLVQILSWVQVPYCSPPIAGQPIATITLPPTGYQVQSTLAKCPVFFFFLQN